MLKKYVINFVCNDHRYSRRVNAESPAAASAALESVFGTVPDRIVSVKEIPASPKTTGRLYVAYGSNLNIGQMEYRCPDAKIYGAGTVKDYRLVFYGVASILPCAGTDVPVGVWKISAADEARLDRYEGFPHLYRKEDVEVVMENGETVTAMAYIMNRKRGESDPTPTYYETIRRGYIDFGLDLGILRKARADVGKYDGPLRNLYETNC